jgi:hypothetical protein
MKSAYELALARMGLQNDGKPRGLTDAQRAELSDLDRRYAAKLAERDIFLRAEIEQARDAGDAERMERANEQLRRERAELEEERELAKERVRQGRS